MARKFTDRTAYNGETLNGRFTAPESATAVRVELADGTRTATVAATKDADGTWRAAAPAKTLTGFSGATRWVALADTPDGTEVIAEGEIFIRALVSPHRAVVAAIEKAVAEWGQSPNKSISVGEVSINAKTLDELLAALRYWRGRVAADERGAKAPAGGIRFMRTEFRHV